MIQLKYLENEPGVEKYSAIYRKHENGEEVTNALESVYTNTKQLSDKFVVHNSADRNYYVFSSYDHFFSMLDKLTPEDRCFHEVIFGWNAQKLKFDLDISAVDLDNFNVDDLENCKPEDKVQNILNVVDETIISTFFIVYGIMILEEDILTTISSGITKEGNYKHSYHKIIQRYVVANNDEAIEFTDKFRKYINWRYYPFIDFGVNKSLQNFRLVLNQKEDEHTSRFKQISSENYTTADTVIQNVDGLTILPPKHKAKPNKTSTSINLSQEEINAAIKILSMYTTDYKVRNITDNLIIYDRIRPNICIICNRVHDKDNTLMAYIHVKINIAKIYLKCRRNNTLSKFIGEFALYEQKTKVDTVFRENKTTIISELDKSYPNLIKDAQANIYDEKVLRPFELVDTLCVKSQMKMGKTKKLKEYIEKHFPTNGLRRYIIRIISFRQTFSSNIKDIFPDFTLYSNIQGQLDQNRLIIQVESLHRLHIYPGIEHPDLLILDECESIFEQFDSGLSRSTFNASFSVFQWLLRNSKYCVAMDANLGDRTQRILQRMRTTPRNSSIFYHCNRWKNAVDDTYYLSTDIITWLAKLYECVSDHKKIVIPASSLTTAEIVHKLIIDKYPNIRIQIYSSKTSISERKEHFANVNLWWTQYDVLIYTPTVSAGVSFEQIHFDKIFAYFINKSCSVETCLQMIGRIRNVTDKEYYICVSATTNNLPTNTEHIRQYLYSGCMNLFKDSNVGTLQFDYNEHGNIRFYDNDYFALWLENTRIYNLSINAFTNRLVEYIKATGAVIKELDFVIAGPKYKAIFDEYKDNKVELDNIENIGISTSIELTLEEVDIIQDKKIKQLDISIEERYAYEKFKIRRHYGWKELMSKEFVADYKRELPKSIFRNLQRIYKCNSFEESLSLIQREEKYTYQCSVNNESYMSYDISRRYTFDQHSIAIGFLQLCTFTSLVDTKCVSEACLFNKFRDSEESIMKNLNHILVKLQLKKPNLCSLRYFKAIPVDVYVSGIVKQISRVLGATYGVKIKCLKNDVSIYNLIPCQLFTLNSADTTRPCVIKAASLGSTTTEPSIKYEELSDPFDEEILSLL